MSQQVDPRLRIPEDDLNRLLVCQHHAPHDHYGWHDLPEGGSVIRTRQLGAESVELLISNDSTPMIPIGNDIWVAELDDFEHAPDYRFIVKYPDSEPEMKADPYHFLPTASEFDLYLITEGRHEKLWEVLGAHVRTYTTNLGEVEGTSFAVWAPNAKGVAVIGEFCAWNPNQYPMRSLGSSGVWEIFIPGLTEGTRYKFAVLDQNGNRTDKADPMARQTDTPPETVSVVNRSRYQWNDQEWMDKRAQVDHLNTPMSVYEVHVGSWKIGMGYRELIGEFVDYVEAQGFTHVEFMPVAEHPFGGSWGYQVSGYYAPSARWGNPDDFRALVDALHQRGIGVIVDWVPAHFPKDEWALGRFDGTALYEHPDWRRGEHPDWGTYVFNYGRNEVRNFLVANALYWIEEFHIDGLRVDAVASMLYRDYSRNHREWEPNEFGGRENLEAVQFLQETNATVHKNHPDVLMIAEESTSWPGVTAPTFDNGLGFSLKWNMGWMNDTLQYFGHDPVHRSYHHNEITFSLVYAFSEKYVLPFSHDEVVHGKNSLWGRMPGDDWNKAAGLRTLYGYMYSHPGKKLLFMGQEFGQTTEWDEAHSVNWADLDGWNAQYHQSIQRFVRDANLIYRDSPELAQDNSPMGFQWVKGGDHEHNTLAYLRWSTEGEPLLAVINLSGSTHTNYTLGVPYEGEWELVLNSDDTVYAGAGSDVAAVFSAVAGEWDGQPAHASLTLPAMSAQWYRPRR